MTGFEGIDPVTLGLKTNYWAGKNTVFDKTDESTLACLNFALPIGFANKHNIHTVIRNESAWCETSGDGYG